MQKAIVGIALALLMIILALVADSKNLRDSTKCVIGGVGVLVGQVAFGVTFGWTIVTRYPSHQAVGLLVIGTGLLGYGLFLRFCGAEKSGN